MTRHSILRTTSALVLASLLLPAAAHAQAQTAAPKDTTFLQDQAQGTAYEMAIARLAVEKAQRPAIKAYAQAVIADHDQLDAQLKMVARIKRVELPGDMTAKQKTELARLQGLSGAGFDQAYLEETARINAQDKSEDEKQFSETQDQTIRQFVQQLQASDKKHLEAGEALKRGD